MKGRLILVIAVVIVLASFVGWRYARAAGDPVVESFRTVEVASVADAMEQLYGTKSYMSHDMRALFKTKFVGPAVTVQLKKEENKDSNALQNMIKAIDTAPEGSAYVLVVEDGLDYGALGGLMGTTLKMRGVAGAIVDASIRDLPQLQRLQFPVYSRGVSPGTTVGHYRATGYNIPVTCAGVQVNPGDLISADEDGVVVIPKDKAAEVLKKAQALDYSEHSTYPFIEQTKSLAEAIAKFGRL